MNPIKINSAYNLQNQKLFKSPGRTSETDFRCVICGAKVNLDYSFSNKGDCLICTKCEEKHFGKDLISMFQWMRSGGEII